MKAEIGTQIENVLTGETYRVVQSNGFELTLEPVSTGVPELGAREYIDVRRFDDGPFVQEAA